MKLVITGVVLIAALASGYLFTSHVAHSGPVPDASSDENVLTAAISPVLVELYTSEGCSSCPPADHLLSELSAQRPEVIALSFHVDYWNGGGWNDRFSSPLYTRRQEIYASKFALDSTYTPQMIVDGAKQFVGSDAKSALDAIERESREKRGTIRLATTAGRLTIEISGLPGKELSTVYFAVTEDGLSSQVSGGENRGVMLSHASVVRSLNAAGVVEKRQTAFEGTAEIPSNVSWKAENVSYVVFVQENSSRQINAAARIR